MTKAYNLTDYIKTGKGPLGLASGVLLSAMSTPGALEPIHMAIAHAGLSDSIAESKDRAMVSPETRFVFGNAVSTNHLLPTLGWSLKCAGDAVDVLARHVLAGRSALVDFERYRPTLYVIKYAVSSLDGVWSSGLRSNNGGLGGLVSECSVANDKLRALLMLAEITKKKNKSRWPFPGDGTDGASLARIRGDSKWCADKYREAYSILESLDDRSPQTISLIKFGKALHYECAGYLLAARGQVVPAAWCFAQSDVDQAVKDKSLGLVSAQSTSGDASGVVVRGSSAPESYHVQFPKIDSVHAEQNGTRTERSSWFPQFQLSLV
jgi:hypothetical protein